jgi:hypothetical protein
MARASIPTILALDRFQKIMGIIPPHFGQGLSGNLFSNSNCSDVWYQYSWQARDQVAREDLALEIHAAEEELASFIGYYPGPQYSIEEDYDYPRFHRRDLWQVDMSNVRYAPKSINLRRGRFIGPGRRATTLIGTATTAGGTLVFADLDLDGFVENARITLPTTLTDVNEIKAFFTGYGGVPEWEIRTERSKTISGGNVILNFYVWQLVDPELWEAFPPTDGLLPVDLTVIANLVASVEVRRVYRDTTQISVQFLWNPDAGCTFCGGTGCLQCGYNTVDGCIYARDFNLGIVVPAPAAYDAASGDWASVTCDACRDPDMLKLWYESGDVDERYKAGFTHDPLSEDWARVIAYMAVARLERPFCTCGNSAALATWLREDLAYTPAGEGSRFTTEDVISSPFGTHRGEVMAWQKVRKLKKRRMEGVII